VSPRVQRVFDEPWRKTVFRRHPSVRRELNRRGLVSPHFTWAEACCKDGSNVPTRRKRNAVRHAWALEELRHELGDAPMPVLSWYRSPEHNKAVGGAVKSRHLKADATDHPTEWVAGVGRERVLAAAERIFANGGIGDYPSGSVHFDSRGWRARWRSFIGQ
jgi:hypothetical protein